MGRKQRGGDEDDERNVMAHFHGKPSRGGTILYRDREGRFAGRAPGIYVPCLRSEQGRRRYSFNSRKTRGSRRRDDIMQREGIVGPPAGDSKSREILVAPDYFEAIDRSLR